MGTASYESAARGPAQRPSRSWMQVRRCIHGGQGTLDAAGRFLGAGRLKVAHRRWRFGTLWPGQRAPGPARHQSAVARPAMRPDGRPLALRSYRHFGPWPARHWTTHRPPRKCHCPPTMTTTTTMTTRATTTPGRTFQVTNLSPSPNLSLLSLQVDPAGLGGPLFPEVTKLKALFHVASSDRGGPVYDPQRRLATCMYSTRNQFRVEQLCRTVVQPGQVAAYTSRLYRM